MDFRKTKVVYLDQKCWINLAKQYFSDSRQRDKDIVGKILEASKKEQIIFPLSLCHLDETNRISNKTHRNQLALLMTKLSQGYTFQPYFDRLIRAEIKNIVLKKFGLTPINIREHIIKQGISNLVGAQATIDWKENESGSVIPKKIRKDLLKKIESPETIELLLKEKQPKSLNMYRKEPVIRMEKIRSDLLRFKDNELRRRAALANNIVAVIAPELAKISDELQLPFDFFLKEKTTATEIEKLLDQIPTALCLFTLIFQRDQQYQRPIEENDFNDIWFLTLAIPYSDIVVTEKTWTSIAKQAKLDKKCKTIILSSIEQLEKQIIS